MTTPNFTPDNEAQRWWKSLSFGEQMVQSYNAPRSSTIEAMHAIHLKRIGDTPAPAPQGVEVPQMKRPLPIIPTPGERSLGQLLYETLHGQVEGMKPLCGEPYASILPESIARYEHAAAIIAKHAPQPEATPAPAASDAGEVQATPKWPRYFQPIGLYQNIYRLKYDSPTSPCKWADGGSDELPHMLTYVADAERDLNYIETDADGNALTQPIEQQQASGVERWGIRSVITLGDEPPYVIEKYRNGQFVKAADHDAAIATLRTRLSRAEQREAESEKYAAGILENLRGFLQLVELGCSVHRNAVVNRPRYYVADVDGKIVSEADEILVAMRNVAMPFNGGDKDA